MAKQFLLAPSASVFPIYYIYQSWSLLTDNVELSILTECFGHFWGDWP